jgi:ribosomal protein L17
MTLKGNETLQELFIRQLKLPGLKSEAGQTISDRVFPTAAGAFLFVNPGRMLEPAEREDPDVMAEARREFPGKFGLPDWTSETAAAEATGIAALRQGLSSFLAQGAIQAWSNLCREQRVALEQLVTSWIQDQLQKTELALTYAQSALTERLELRRAHESKLVAVQAEVEEIQTNMGQIERLKTSLFEKIEQAKDKALEELRVLKVGG